MNLGVNDVYLRGILPTAGVVIAARLAISGRTLRKNSTWRGCTIRTEDHQRDGTSGRADEPLIQTTAINGILRSQFQPNFF
jgi:hypothetical protein